MIGPNYLHPTPSGLGTSQDKGIDNGVSQGLTFDPYCLWLI